MTISFTSTYRVPFKQPRKSINPAKKDALKELATKHGGIVPSSRQGNVKLSVKAKLDSEIQAELKNLGFNNYTMVAIHNVPSNQIVDALEYKDRFKTLNPANKVTAE